MMSPDEAAHKILQGVAFNKAIILTDVMAKSLWWLFRLSPTLFERLVSRITVVKDK